MTDHSKSVTSRQEPMTAESLLKEAVGLLLEHQQAHGHHLEHPKDEGSDWRFRRDVLLDKCSVIVWGMVDK